MIVLDTHALVWMIEGEERLGNAARDLIEAARTTNGAVVPAICAWEIALLARRDRIALSLAPLPWFDLVLATPGSSWPISIRRLRSAPRIWIGAIATRPTA